jgi:hypothetical protein
MAYRINGEFSTLEVDKVDLTPFIQNISFFHSPDDSGFDLIAEGFYDPINMIDFMIWLQFINAEKKIHCKMVLGYNVAVYEGEARLKNFKVNNPLKTNSNSGLDTDIYFKLHLHHWMPKLTSSDPKFK